MKHYRFSLISENSTTGTHGHKVGNNRYRGLKNGGKREGAKVEKLSNGYYDHYLGDGFTRSPDLSITQHTHETNLHMYSLNLK